MPFGINGVDRLLAAFEALFNERKHRPILVIVAVEKTAYMRPADHCVTEPNRTDALSELSRANGLVVGRIHRDCLFITGSDAFSNSAPDRRAYEASANDCNPRNPA